MLAAGLGMDGSQDLAPWPRRLARWPCVRDAGGRRKAPVFLGLPPPPEAGGVFGGLCGWRKAWEQGAGPACQRCTPHTCRTQLPCLSGLFHSALGPRGPAWSGGFLGLRFRLLNRWTERNRRAKGVAPAPLRESRTRARPRDVAERVHSHSHWRPPGDAGESTPCHATGMTATHARAARLE